MNRFTWTLSTVATTLALTAGAALAADPTTADCLAASDASLQLGNHHQLRAERSQLLVCAAQTCPADIRKECLHRVDDVNAQIPTIVLSAKDGTGADLSAVKVTMDGKLLTERLEGTALSVDPGEHTFTFKASGRPAVSRRIVIEEGQKDRRETVLLGAPTSETEADTGESRPSPSEPPAGRSPRKVIAFVTGGVGLGLLGLAAYYQATALSRERDSDAAASSADPGTQATARAIHDQAVQGQTYALVSGGLGVSAVVAGVILLLGAPRSGVSHTSPSLGPAATLTVGATGVSLSATW